MKSTIKLLLIILTAFSFTFGSTIRSGESYSYFQGYPADLIVLKSISVKSAAGNYSEEKQKLLELAENQIPRELDRLYKAPVLEQLPSNIDPKARVLQFSAKLKVHFKDSDGDAVLQITLTGKDMKTGRVLVYFQASASKKSTRSTNDAIYCYKHSMNNLFKLFRKVKRTPKVPE